MAPKYKLTYGAGKGLGEPIRFILSYGGVEFEDVRLNMEDWPKVKTTMPFGKIPVLEVDGKTVHQSVAICRYLAKQFGLAGKNDWEDLEIDIVVDTFGDLRKELTKHAHETDEALKAKHKETVLNETLPYYLPKFEEMLKKNGGYFACGKLTWADLTWVATVDTMSSRLGMKLPEKYSYLKALEEKVLALPVIKAWVAKRPVTDW